MVRLSNSFDMFTDETTEHLERIESLLAGIDLSKGAPDGAIVNDLFRALHTIKGGAGLLDLPNMRLVAHVAESVLSAIRNGEREFDEAVVDALLRGHDVLADMLGNLDEESSFDVTDEIAQLEACLGSKAPELPGLDQCGILVFNDDLPYAEGWDPFESATPDTGGESLPALEITPSEDGAAVEFAQTDAAPRRERPEHSPPKSAERPLMPAARGNESVRVPLWVLDRLMALAGELVLVRNRTRQNFEQKLQRDRDLASSADRRLLQQLDLVTGELQENILRTRMQPVDRVLSKIPKLCRDLSKKLGKKMTPVITGAEVEVDKTILECLSDPLLHLIRNSCDHGIEPPEDREAAGKPPEGTISVHAQHESGQISVTVSDDGKGIDTERVANLAVERGIRTPAEIATMTERQLCALVFAPGFSTATEVTDISGRGVGMDVVRSATEAVGGTVDVDSTPGKGTTFTLRLPLSLAIVPSLIVRDGSETFAIPHVNLEEVIRRHRDENAIRISYINNLPVIRVRGTIVPIVELGKVLSSKTEPHTDFDDEKRTDSREAMTVAVVRVSKMRIGIIVDEAVGSEEVVVKPNHPLLPEQRCFVGSTILGDGRVALILDTNGICEHAGLSQRFIEHAEADEASVTGVGERQYLLFTVTGDDRFLVPLTDVSRLVPIASSQLRTAGGATTVKLPDGNLRVIGLDHHLGLPANGRATDDRTLILPRHIHLPVGFLASRVIDIVTLSHDISQVIHRSDHVVGSTTICETPALILDLAGIARAEEPSWFDSAFSAKPGACDPGPPFSEVTPLIESSHSR